MSEQSQSNPTVDPEVTDETAEVLDPEATDLEDETPEPTDEIEGNENDEDEAEPAEFSDLTPYAAAGVANRRLGGPEGQKPRTSQTFYSYGRNHSIKSSYDSWVAQASKTSGYKVHLDGSGG